MIFRNWVLQNFPFLEDDFDALTDYELFCKMVEYMKKSLDKIKDYQTEINIFTVKLNEFQHYFDNLDVTEEVNAKLDEMVEDGTMQELIAQYLQLKTTYTYNNIEELKEAQNLVAGMFIRTSGYYSYNDGGGAYYKVRNVLVSDVIDDMLIIGLDSNEVVAELVQGNIINVNQLGAYGDGIHDDTIAIQTALDTDSNITFNSGKTYLVSKNSNLDYEDHDEPCLLINKNKIVYGNNASLIVEAHAQGIIEINNANNVIVQDLILISNGEQLPLDGTTGLGEKGNSSAGYDTEAIWGLHYNNSYDTSNLILHGNSGNPWGTFNDGYIGNVAAGILIRNTSHDITIENCNISGFNFAGIEIGTHAEAQANINESYNINICNNTIHDIYDAGICSTSAKDINITNNKIYSIGHEDATKTDTNQNPGYGITLKGSNKETNKCIISNNIINDCVRKGIDLHGGNKIIVDTNITNNCMVSGIFAQTQYVNNLCNNININNNHVYNCSYSVNQLNPIHVEGVISADSEDKTEKEVIITNNQIYNCGGLRSFIDIATGKNVIISGNMIKGKTSESSNYAVYGILVGLGGRQLSNYGVITGNLINVDNSVTVGIIVNNINDCVISNNMIKCGSDTKTTNYMSSSKVLCYGNYNSNGKCNESQVGLGIPKVDNLTSLNECQLATYGDALCMTDTGNHKSIYPRYISFLVQANGTNNPTISQIWGSSEYLDEVINDSYGFKIKLKNTNNNFNPNLIVSSVSSTPITTSSSVVCEYYYLRTRSKDEVVIGIKQNGSSGTHYAITNCTSGTLMVIILM